MSATATKEPNGTTAIALPEPVSRRGISEAQWRTLCNNLFPGATSNSVLMVWDYCVARRLDPLKKPCHIVPMEVKDAKTGKYEYRDVVMPGIYEHRTTATRTGLYMGHSEPTYSDAVVELGGGVSVPEWCAMSMYRWNPESKTRAEFPVRVWFREVVATKKDGKPNARWTKAPIQMLTKCTEAAGLREAFPDELGGEQTAEEMDGQRAVDHEDKPVPALVKPDGYDAWLPTLAAAAKQGEAEFSKVWEASPTPCRVYLTTTDPDSYEDLKTTAKDVESA